MALSLKRFAACAAACFRLVWQRRTGVLPGGKLWYLLLSNPPLEQANPV
jgi:hypothetical protein